MSEWTCPKCKQESKGISASGWQCMSCGAKYSIYDDPIKIAKFEIRAELVAEIREKIHARSLYIYPCGHNNVDFIKTNDLDKILDDMEGKIKPVEVKKEMWQEGFEEGIIWAIAEIMRTNGDKVLAQELLNASGIDISEMKIDRQDKIQINKLKPKEVEK